MPTAVILSEEYDAQIRRVVRETIRRERGSPKKHGQHGGRRDRFKWGVLTENLAAAVNALTSPSTACTQLLKRNADGDLQTVNKFYTVVNRFEFVSMDSGTIVKFEFLEGEWSLYSGDCFPTGLSFTSGGCA